MKFLILILNLFFLTGYSQNLRIIYLFSSRPDYNSANTNKREMALEINKNNSVFYDYQGFKEDSLYTETKKFEISDGNMSYKISKQFDKQYFVYEEIMDGDKYIYQDSISLDWKITSDKKKIGDYNVTKALTRFRGRKWEAWFCDKIPIPLGPYKFGGLPGLILEMKDSSGDYQFAFLGIQKKITPNSQYPSRINFSSSYTITRKKFLKEIELNKKDPARKFKALVYNNKIKLVDKKPEEIIKEIEKKAKENQINNPLELTDK
ncbi:GLPGLI family protein [Chryseobacterium scophthalmum]|uniref:GLPGLI family protein n=1 Tax=Chryseobacterium scophthalmum TaxID=59733 RepID=A0A1N6EXX7_9FLAO|nr:GLPGLI family protein [Chryseobacterium scophthalmum]SIN87803.1 GLPGLI family protein [Chryseobacterium scophthalmum]